MRRSAPTRLAERIMNRATTADAIAPIEQLQGGRRLAGKPAWVLVNTRAGGSDVDALRETLSRCFDPIGRPWTLVERRKGQSRRRLTREALDNGHELIVAAGGDGTVSKVASCIVGTNANLGILPCGTTNLLARELGIPLDVDEAAALLAGDHDVRRIDAIDIGDRHLICQLSLGLYAHVAASTNKKEKRRWGRPAYIVQMIREVWKQRSWRFQIRIDGRELRPRASFVLAANVGEVGIVGLRWKEKARPDDGVLDVCVVRARTPAQYLTLFARALVGRHETSDAMETYRAERELFIRAAPSTPVRGDGNVVGKGSVLAKVKPAALPVVVPLAAGQ